MKNSAAPGSGELPYLFILKNGPVYFVDDHVGYQLEALSRRFRGELWATSSVDQTVQVGQFVVNLVKHDERKKGFHYSAYFKKVLARAASVAAMPGDKAVITYDPFRNGMLGLLIKRKYKWPLIVEINGCFGNPDTYERHAGLLQSTVKPALLRTLGRFVLRRADGIRLLFREQLEGFAKPAKNTVVRQYFDAVPLDRFPPQPAEPFILHVGFPYYLKGVDVLVAAFEAIKDEFPAWKLVLIGHLLEECIPNAPARVEVLRAVPNRQVAGWISRCGIFALASRSEAMGRVLIEAAAAGKPRVASAVGGTYTVVQNRVDGLLFEKGNVQELAQTLRTLMSDESLRMQLGAAARDRALRDFNAERYVDYVADLVAAVCSRGR